jgi:aspartate aminotransferase
MQLSSLLTRFNEPETLKMAKLGRELRAKGFDIIDLSLGEPDFDTPEYIKDAAKKAIDENWSHYTPVCGYLELRQAICHKLKRDNGLDYTPEQIVVSTGAKQSIANTVLAIVDTGDEVVIPTPYWVTYSEIVRLAGGKVKFINTHVDTGYKVTPQQLEEALTDKTKFFMFSSPNNPSGAVYSKAELEALVPVFEKYPNVFIMSDEIYEYINFAEPHYSIASFPSLKERVILINGLSKGFAMTGWRLGFIAASPEVIKGCEKIQGQFTSAPNSIAQRAGITAFNSELTETYKMVEQFKLRRQKVMELIKSFPLVECNEPDGAFYIFPQVDKYFGKKYNGNAIANADDLCMYLLNESHVSTVTGSAFGEPKCIRISFANNMKNIEEGFKRIKDGLEKLID